jgi:hypothetical protein
VQAQVAAVLGDHPVRRQQVDEQAQAGSVEAERAAECLGRAAAARLQAVDQAELEGGLERARVDDRAQELVDDEKLELPRRRRQRSTLATLLLGRSITKSTSQLDAVAGPGS